MNVFVDMWLVCGHIRHADVMEPGMDGSGDGVWMCCQTTVYGVNRWMCAKCGLVGMRYVCQAGVMVSGRIAMEITK